MLMDGTAHIELLADAFATRGQVGHGVSRRTGRLRPAAAAAVRVVEPLARFLAESGLPEEVVGVLPLPPVVLVLLVLVVRDVHDCLAVCWLGGLHGGGRNTRR